MSEWITFGWRYDATPLVMFRMMTRLEHLRAQARVLGHEHYTLRELREREGQFRVDAQYEAPRTRRIFAPRTVVRHTQIWSPPTWDGARRYDGEFQVSGLAVRVTGRGELTPDGPHGTRYTLRAMISGHGRLLPRHTEKSVAAALAEQVEREHAFRQSWLSTVPTQAA